MKHIINLSLLGFHPNAEMKFLTAQSEHIFETMSLLETRNGRNELSQVSTDSSEAVKGMCVLLCFIYWFMDIDICRYAYIYKQIDTCMCINIYEYT